MNKKIRRMRERRIKMRRRRIAGIILLCCAVFIIVTIGKKIYGAFSESETASKVEETVLAEPPVEDRLPDYVKKDIIPVNGEARRGEKLEGVNDIVIHYTGNPGTTAEQNRNFYAQPDTKVSSHFLIGMDGAVIQCIPLDEKSSASNERNRDTISVEVCHKDETGKFTDASYNRLVELTSWLCKSYNLDTDHVIRHYDVTGKECPLYFVKHPDEWNKFLDDVEKAME